MAETTGAHHFDVGDGPQRVSVITGYALEGAAQTAYRAYLDHRPDCAQCQTSLFICEDAKVLWQAYKDASA